MRSLRRITVLFLVLVFSGSFAQESGHQLTISKAKYFRKTIPLRDMEVILPGERDRSWKDGIIRNEFIPEEKLQYNENALPAGPDPVLQSFDGSRAHRGPYLNFDGVGNVNGVIPPDTDGDVGPDHYFQMINLSFAIWDKEGNKLYGPVDNSTLWNGFIGPWTGTNDGDPILLYDEMADRWMASQFAINTFNGTFWQLIAISATADPLGSYYQYAFQYPAFNDYPKFGIWPDGYYASFNMFGLYRRVAVSAYERDKMLTGDPEARMVLFDLPEGSAPWSMLPADFDGPPPPADAPNYFMYFEDDDFGAPEDRLILYEFEVDWNDPLSSTFEQVQALPVAPFKAQLCEAPRWQCIPQPNSNIKLEAISDRLMFRLQYRNFGDYATMVTNHTVNADGEGKAGIRWYELRNDFDGNNWYVYQQGTYSPDDNSRWMGSIAMNGEGYIALGYTISSDTIFPSIRYTGRSPDAPPGEMNLAEIEIIRGLGSQGTYNRWGDYSMMSVDPTDDKTFWYTQEYSIGGWKTRICSFDFSPVLPPFVDAGPDTNICSNEALFRTPFVEHYKSVYWNTSGDGFFQNPRNLKGAYLRGPEDIKNGSVVLGITVYGYLEGQQAYDDFTLYIDTLPVADAGKDTMICVNQEYTLQGTAKNFDEIYWSTNGDGSFDNASQVDATYFPGTADTSNGFVELLLTAIGYTCEDTARNSMNLYFDPCFGIGEDEIADAALNIFPNPTSGVFELSISGIHTEGVELLLLNSRGQEIFRQTLGRIENTYSKRFNLSYLPKGTYFVKLQSDKGARTARFLLQ